MNAAEIYWWKKAPFIRLLLWMMAGIAVQWYAQIPLKVILFAFVLGIIGVVGFFTLSFSARYRFAVVNGIFIMILFTSIGAGLVWCKDIRNRQSWLPNVYHSGDASIASIDEPSLIKAKTIRANATISFFLRNGQRIPVSCHIIIYFKNDSAGIVAKSITYGTQILFRKSLQEIKNAGNPGSFDFQRYSLFHGFTHQVYLQPGEFEILPEKKEKRLDRFLYRSQETVLTALQTNITHRKEQGLAEALLIGYKNDLDPSLVQSYTNTGVVHIIAISGMHLALIYWLLLIIFKPLDKIKKISLLKPILVIVVLWMFSLLTGASASVMRSAIMLTAMVVGKMVLRKSSMQNSLAASAFFLLCYDPFWLWDVGFQLSFAAVLSIVTFMQPIYNLMFVKNKIVDFFWQLTAVTLAAQILTTPLSLYHFHQFPNLFLLTNFVAVPISSIILIGEILICTIAFIPLIAGFTGQITQWLIWIMNTWIERIEMIPFAIWKNIQIGFWQTILLYFFILTINNWLINRSIKFLRLGLACLLAFFALRSFSFLSKSSQRKVIVYNTPKQSAIDFITGRKYFFVGDTLFNQNNTTINFYLQPSRIIDRTSKMGSAVLNNSFFIFNGMHILFINHTVAFVPSQSKPVINLLIVAKNPRLYIARLAEIFDIKKIIFDASNQASRLNYWKKDCDSLHIPYHDVSTNGAFVMTIR